MENFDFEKIFNSIMETTVSEKETLIPCIFTYGGSDTIIPMLLSVGAINLFEWLKKEDYLLEEIALIRLDEKDFKPLVF